MTYSPLGGGLLTGKYGLDRRPTQGRIVDNAMYATRYGDEESLDVAERLSQLAAELELNPVSLAIAWVAAHPAVTAPIIGARSLDQLDACLASLEVPMDEALRHRVAGLSREPPPATDRSEESSAHNYGSR